MQYILKTPLPDDLQEKLANALSNNLSWSSFRAGRGGLRQHLSAEQKGLCAYSGLCLSQYGYHIDHIKPKSITAYASLRFDPENLLASAPENQSKVKKAELFGGHKKENNYDTDFISPTEVDCERYFQYSPNGDIAPKSGLTKQDKIRATKTIKLLGLQSSCLLRNKRRSVYKTINEQLKYVLEQPESSKFLINDYLNGCNPKPFPAMARQIFNLP